MHKSLCSTNIMISEHSDDVEESINSTPSESMDDIF